MSHKTNTDDLKTISGLLRRAAYEIRNQSQYFQEGLGRATAISWIDKLEKGSDTIEEVVKNAKADIVLTAAKRAAEIASFDFDESAADEFCQGLYAKHGKGEQTLLTAIMDAEQDAAEALKRAALCKAYLGRGVA